MSGKIKTLLGKNKKALIFISVLAALLAAGSLITIKIRGGYFNQPSTRTVQVERGAIIETVDGTGVVTAKPSAKLSWESGGYVSDYSLAVGDHVEKGTTILTLRDDSKAAEVLQAESSLLDAQAELDKMLAADADLIAALEDVQYQEHLLTNKYSMRHEFYSNDVSDARIEAVYANYHQAREEVRELEGSYEKVKKLDKDDPQREQAYAALQAGILKRDSLLRALSQIMGTPYGQRAEGYFIAYDLQKQATAESRAAYERLLDSSDEIAAARARVQALQNTIDQASIIAPFPGTITAIHSIAGEKVNPGDIAIQLDDLSNLVVELGISQMDINKINLGQSANLTLNAVPGTIYTGTVAEISESGVVDDDGNTTYKVTVAITDPDEQIKTGFNATASIIINQVEDALLVPNTAIQYDDDGNAFVISVNSMGLLNQVPVEIGARTDAVSELVSGELREGDQLAVAQIEGEFLQVGHIRDTGLPLFNFLR